MTGTVAVKSDFIEKVKREATHLTSHLEKLDDLTHKAVLVGTLVFTGEEIIAHHRCVHIRLC